MYDNNDDIGKSLKRDDAEAATSKSTSRSTRSRARKRQGITIVPDVELNDSPSVLKLLVLDGMLTQKEAEAGDADAIRRAITAHFDDYVLAEIAPAGATTAELRERLAVLATSKLAAKTWGEDHVKWMHVGFKDNTEVEVDRKKRLQAEQAEYERDHAADWQLFVRCRQYRPDK
jgi:hypothetical protein